MFVQKRHGRALMNFIGSPPGLSVPAGGRLVCIVAAWALGAAGLMAQDRDLYVTPLSLEQMSGKQGVLETDLGSIVIDLLPEHAPNHVGLFIELAEAGEYDGTIFHRMVKHGIVQGGDPLTKDPARADVYGRGGLGLVASEVSDQRHTRGAVSAVLASGQPNSGGMQFFICVVEQPSLDGAYTIWARVVEGMDVVTMISETPVDGKGRAVDRVVVRSVTVRDRQAPEPIPFSKEDVPDEELSAYRAVLETEAGDIEIDFYPDRAPNHVRNFLRLAAGGVFDGMAFHRIVEGFVIQTGHLPSRQEPLTERQQQLIQPLEPEFSDTPHVAGIVSMARGDDVNSATTSFFICTDVAEELDGQYTVFGVVSSGLDAVKAIERTPKTGETPDSRVGLTRVRVVRR